MATKALLSLEEFDHLPDDGTQHELDEGELVTMPPPKARHGKTASRIYNRLLQHAQKSGYEVQMEVAFVLQDDPPILRQPDVAMITKARFDEVGDHEYYRGAPELAVEVVSPSEDYAELDRKVVQYLAAGSVLVWVVVRQNDHVRIFRADGTTTVKHGGETLDAPELLPGWSLPVSEIFA